MPPMGTLSSRVSAALTLRLFQACLRCSALLACLRCLVPPRVPACPLECPLACLRSASRPRPAPSRPASRPRRPLPPSDAEPRRLVSLQSF